MEILLGIVIGVVITVIAGVAWFVHTFKDMWG